MPKFALSVTFKDVISHPFIRICPEVGLNIPVVQLTNNRRLLLNFNYRANLCFTDKLDGYVPTVQANEKNDAYNALTVGMVYNF